MPKAAQAMSRAPKLTQVIVMKARHTPKEVLAAKAPDVAAVTAGETALAEPRS